MFNCGINEKKKIIIINSLKCKRSMQRLEQIKSNLINGEKFSNYRVKKMLIMICWPFCSASR